MSRAIVIEGEVTAENVRGVNVFRDLKERFLQTRQDAADCHVLYGLNDPRTQEKSAQVRALRKEIDEVVRGLKSQGVGVSWPADTRERPECG